MPERSSTIVAETRNAALASAQAADNTPHSGCVAACKILAVSDLWLGSNGYAFVRAFQRGGHSVQVINSDAYIPWGWTHPVLRLIRKAVTGWCVRDFGKALVAAARAFQPDILFVFKGRWVRGQDIEAIQRLGTTAINFYPDVSFLAHGPYIKSALPKYDWVFSTKSFGLADMGQALGVTRASFLPHGYDPEIHCPLILSDSEQAYYGCDVSFIGTWSPKKQQFLEALVRAMPGLSLKIWGAQWASSASTLGPYIQWRGVRGVEYAKALIGSKINLGLLSEVRLGASHGDQITSRTFHIPATGAFMLHERTAEFLTYFTEDAECGCFASADELVDRVRHYLSDSSHRLACAAAARERCVRDGYSVDARAAEMLAHTQRLAETQGTAIAHKGRP